MNAIPIGHILILHEEFDKVRKNPNESPAITRRASILCVLLEELIGRREQEAQIEQPGEKGASHAETPKR